MHLCMVFANPVSVKRSHFMTHIPIRTRSMLPIDSKLTVLYNGVLQEDLLKMHDIAARKVRAPAICRNNLIVRLVCTAFAAYQLGKKRDVDIFINANSHHYAFAIAVGAHLAAKPLILRVTGILPTPKNADLKKKIRKFWGRVLTRLSLSRADKIICLSQELKNILVENRCVPNKLFVISQGVDLNRFRFTPREDTIPALRLLFVGRFSANKGIEDLLSAFVILLKEYPKMTLTLCGDGEMRVPLLNRFGGVCNVNFQGYVSHEQMPRVYQDADVLILPSYSEGLPNVILEAMATGLAVIATDIGDNKRLLGNNQRGLLFEPGNIYGIVNNVKYLMGNEALRRSLISQARKYVECEHGLDVVWNKTCEVFNSAVR